MPDGGVQFGDLLPGVHHHRQRLAPGMVGGGGRGERLLQPGGVGVQPDVAAGGQDVEHRSQVLPGAHGQGQLGVADVGHRATGAIDVGEPVNRVQGQQRGGVGVGGP